MRGIALGPRVPLELDDDVGGGPADAHHPAELARDEEGRQPVHLEEAAVGQARQPGDIEDDVVACPQFRELGDGGRGTVEGALRRGMAPGSKMKAVSGTEGLELERQGVSPWKPRRPGKAAPGRLLCVKRLESATRVSDVESDLMAQCSIGG